MGTRSRWSPWRRGRPPWWWWTAPARRPPGRSACADSRCGPRPARLSSRSRMPTLTLIDGSGFIFRAYHAIPHLSTTKGVPTNAVYGFTTMLLKALREHAPTHVALVFDAGRTTFRHEIDVRRRVLAQRLEQH